jgi:hypothetical protein
MKPSSLAAAVALVCGLPSGHAALTKDGARWA